ncbi:MAG: 30S ribosomal protein S12 methylthiotransferase RimO [Lachnospiraceae bacterium]|nr:30S ribosomal protein S12 methylthiotransferase RimO [Lachnospiraceae bacterium]MBR3510223.1 30S ribosomal protein S12 methylthiotransferase RimO [Lachnospiraceae bacterium]MBR4607371.1 30S ribosomal protein S12 methylthiotransferase RimO [Lachnospiraceae bacterium]MBR6151584.1 30S ribosomal protein S12 methylthiotransferase RimO [Lachnospiraceae bacterium]
MKILFTSLGCDKNLVDTEMMLGLLEAKGHTFTDDEDEAEAVIVNTCCFIGDAKEESINTLLEFAERRKTGEIKALLACGCLAQRYRDEIQKEIPEVDAIVGTNAIKEIVEALEGVLAKAPKNYFRDLNETPVAGLPQIVTTGGHYAYLKIAEGCDKHCTYCIIPKVRGGYRSIPMETLLAQAEGLAQKGVKELILVAQETTLYGVDLYGKKCLPELLQKLAKISGIYWIRILYCYPEEITDELIEVMATEPKICHYLDIPIQHASDAVLKRMGRRTDQASLRGVIARLRERIPDICLRTTLISGFPGESQEDFEELYNFVDEMEFDRLGVFPYSREEDTAADVMEDQIPEEIKCQRRDELMELQQEIAFEKAEEMVGRILVVMIEGKVADEDTYVARTYRDAPNVDGYLFLNTTANLMTGDLVKVMVTDANEYDLIGEVYDD